MSSVLLGAARRYAPVRARLTECPGRATRIHLSHPTRHAAEDDDLFGITSDQPVAQTMVGNAANSPQKHANTREQKFHDRLRFVSDRTGRVKVVKAGQVRATVWLRLFQLASKPEHLEAVAETFPRWRESGKSFTTLDDEMFVRRCMELNCPLLALKVFGDHPKYGLPLSSISAARTLLHSLYRTHPLQNTIAAVSLFGINNLPPVTSDPASCAMLYAACLRSENKHASLLGRDIRTALKKLLRETTPYPEPQERLLRARYSVKPNLWLLEALKEIKEIKRAHGRGSWWVTEWIASGEGRTLPPLSERRYPARVGRHPREVVAPVTESKLVRLCA